MSMSMTRRLQILIDEDRYSRLAQTAKRRGASVAEVVREGIDAVAPAEDAARRAAIARFLEADPIEVGDWEDMKKELDSRYDDLAP